MSIEIKTLEEFSQTYKGKANPDYSNTLFDTWCHDSMTEEQFCDICKQVGYPYYCWRGKVVLCETGEEVTDFKDGHGVAMIHGDTFFQIQNTEENAFSTLTNTPGAGPIVAAQPGSQPGHIGSFGSGDISSGLGGKIPGIDTLSSIGTKHPAKTIAGSMFAASKKDDTKSGSKKKRKKAKRKSKKPAKKN